MEVRHGAWICAQNYLIQKAHRRYIKPANGHGHHSNYFDIYTSANWW